MIRESCYPSTSVSVEELLTSVPSDLAFMRSTGIYSPAASLAIIYIVGVVAGAEIGRLNVHGQTLCHASTYITNPRKHL